MDHAAVHLNRRLTVKHIVQHARRQRRARPCPAGERNACAAFPDAHARMAAVTHLDELCIDLMRKRRVMLKLGTELFQRKAVCIIHKDHAVRVAHRDTGHRVFLARDHDGLCHNVLRTEARHGDTRPLKHGNAHIHSDRRHGAVLHNDARHHRPRQCLDGELVLRHVPLFIEPA